MNISQLIKLQEVISNLQAQGIILSIKINHDDFYIELDGKSKWYNEAEFQDFVNRLKEQSDKFDNLAKLKTMLDQMREQLLNPKLPEAVVSDDNTTQSE